MNNRAREQYKRKLATSLELDKVKVLEYENTSTPYIIAVYGHEYRDAVSLKDEAKLAMWREAAKELDAVKKDLRARNPSTLIPGACS